LTASTAYDFYQRIAENSSYEASPASPALNVTTRDADLLDQAAPAAPTLDAKTDTSVTLEVLAGAEYSKDGTTWQDDPEFTGLSPATAYSFFQRLKETATEYASPASPALEVTTDLAPQDAPAAAPILDYATSTSVTLKPLPGGEYCMDSCTDPSTGWQSTLAFSGLAVHSTHSFYQRYAAYGNHAPSGPSDALSTTTLEAEKDSQEAPDAPTLFSQSATSVTLNTLTGAEYSMDGETWQASPDFTDLSPGTSYSFYQRLKETATAYASPVSDELTVITDKVEQAAPDAPTLDSKTATTIKLVPIAGGEYSIDGENWQTTPTFAGLAPGSTHTLYQRYAESLSGYVSPESPGLEVTTFANTQTAPAAPTLNTRTTDTVTLNTIEGGEYRLADGTWQDSPIFTGLVPGIDYSFTQRFKGTDTLMASPSSAALIVTTLTTDLGTQAAPPAPTLDDATDTTITLVVLPGGEYSIGGSSWQASETFTGLTPGTSYELFQRYAETATDYASDASPGLTVVTELATQVAPPMPTVEERATDWVRLESVAGAEYCIDECADPTSTWQASRIFDGLDADSSHTFYQRYKADATHQASDPSPGLTISTRAIDLELQPQPDVPELLLATDVSIRLVPIAGGEYSIDGGTTWQDSAAFTGLDPATEYTFTQRLKGTTFKYASPASEPSTFATEKTAQAAPPKPVADVVTTTTVTLVPIENGLYSEGGGTWSDNPEFIGLEPGGVYTFYQKYAETDTLKESAVSPVLALTTLSVDLDSQPAPDAPTLDAISFDTVTLMAIDGGQYRIDGGAWQDSPVFSGLEPETTHTFAQRLAGVENEKYPSAASPDVSFTTTPMNLDPRAAPAAPTLASKTDVSVILNDLDGGQYSLDGTTWQDSPTFDNLTPGHAYNFYQRYAQTDVYFASPASLPLLEMTDLTVPDTPDAPVADEVHSTSVKLVPITGGQYSMDGTSWQDSPTFAGLTASTAYTFYQRIAATATNVVSATSDPLNVTTEAAELASQSAPAAPVVDVLGATSVKLKTIAYGQYSMDGEHWQDDPEFTGLSPVTSYTFYQRLAGIAGVVYPSPASEGLPVITDLDAQDKPDAPEISFKTDTVVGLVAIPGGEYSDDNGTTWQIDPLFTGLTPGTEYTFLQRYAATALAYASDPSDPLEDETEPAAQSAPTPPVLVSKTDATLAFEEDPALEYTIDGGTTWQPAAEFTGLAPATQYLVQVRRAGTDTLAPSPASQGLYFTTDKASQLAPPAPTAHANLGDSIELDALAGAEYSIDNGETWQASPVFTGLVVLAPYVFVQRYAETATQLPSPASDPLNITTDKLHQDIPVAPVAEAITDTSVTVKELVGGEYSIDRGTTWTTNRVFTGLTPGTEYVVIQRMAASDLKYASGESAPLTVKTVAHVTGLTIDAPTTFLYKASGEGNTLQLGVAAVPDEAPDKSVTWASSDPTIATVDATGLVTFLDKEGTVNISATSNDGGMVTDVKPITVSRNVTAIRTPLTTVYLAKGKSLALPVTLEDSTSPTKAVSSALTWTSSNTKVLTVSSSGTIKAKTVKKNTTVTVKATAGSGKTQSIKVIVTPKAKANTTVKATVPKSLKVGKTGLAKVTVTKGATGVKVTFKSSKASIVSVDKAGKLIAKKKGKAVITIKAGKKSVKKTVKVT
jgi:uncharacterized protein YjdB